MNKDNIITISDWGMFAYQQRDLLSYWSGPPPTLLVDSKGRTFRVRGCKSKGWAWWLFLLGSKRPPYRVQWQLEPMLPIPFSDLRQIVIDMVCQRRWFSQSWENDQQFRSRIEKTSSYKELFREANFYGRWRG
jgi:hypothetical protein